MIRQISLAAVAAFLYAAAPLAAGAATLDERMEAARAPIAVTNGRLTGAGANVLLGAVRDATYTFIGEDHGTVETPAFADALDADAAGHFDGFVLETGPLVTPLLAQWIAQPTGAIALASFERAHPGTLAFYTWRDEFAFLQRARARTPQLRLFGVDQELMGSAEFLLQQVAHRSEHAQTREMASTLASQAAAATSKALASGNPLDFYMMSAPQNGLDALRQRVAAEHDTGAMPYVDALLASRSIYADCCNQNASLSNSRRAALMKHAFEASGAKTLAGRGRLLFKFGAEHVYRGLNPLHNDDLGNYMAEVSQMSGRKSVHILVLGVAGDQLKFAGAGRWETHPYTLYDSDHDIYSALRPLAEKMYPDAWTLYDLQKLRPHFNALGLSDYNFEKVVFGYDFLVLIPRTTADAPLAPGLF